MRKFIFLPILLTLGIASQIFAQNTFHRVYDPLFRDHFSSNMIPNSDGFYVLNSVPTEGTVNLISISKLSPKGDELWTKDYRFGEDSLRLTPFSDLTLLREDSLAFTVLVAGDEDEEAKKIVAKLAPNGDIMWSTKTGVFESNMIDTVITKIITPFDLRPTLFSSVTDTNSQLNITMTKFDTVSSALHLSTRISGIDTELNLPISMEFADVKNNSFDSTFVISGFALRDQQTFGPLICHVDSNGIGSRAFMLRDSSTYLLIGNEVEQLSPVQFAVGGLGLDLLTGRQVGHVTLIDSIDQVAWSKLFIFGEFNSSTVNGVESLDNGDLLVSGEYLDVFAGRAYIFMVRMDPNGDIIWQRQYDKVLTGFTNIETLSPTPDGLFAYYGTGVNPQNGSLLNHLMVVDEFGESMCADTIVDTIVVDNPVGIYEFSMQSFEEGVIDTMLSESDVPDSLYNLKIVSLLDTVFCPNDPIMVTLDATLPNADGAIGYNWSTGDSTPTLFVEEEGMYMVTVTFDDEDGCYALCDTSIISTYDSTMVNIVADISPYCEDRTINLVANASGGFGPYEFDWSNGEDDNIISIAFDATPIQVTAVDQCGIEAFAGYQLDPAQLPVADEFEIFFNTQWYCDFGEIRLEIASSPQSNVGGLSNIVWTNAAGDTIATSASVITVPDFGSYAFTAIDNCLYEVGDDIDFSEDDLPTPGTIDIEFGGFESFCVSGFYNLTVVPTGDNVGNFEWSTGSTEQSINVAETGTYSVTATDCGRELTASFTIPADIIPDVGIIQIETNDDSLCTTGEVLLTASVNGGSGFFSDFMWSNGEIGESISIIEFGQTLTVSTLDCDRAIQDSITYEPNLDNAVRWPSALAPGLSDALPEDEVFGPVIECPEAVVDYELRIYNRLGQLIFETDDPLALWNGTKDGEQMPSDTYVYYSRYEINGIQGEVNGTVILIR